MLICLSVEERGWNQLYPVEERGWNSLLYEPKYFLNYYLCVYTGSFDSENFVLSYCTPEKLCISIAIIMDEFKFF